MDTKEHMLLRPPKKEPLPHHLLKPHRKTVPQAETGGGGRISWRRRHRLLAEHSTWRIGPQPLLLQPWKPSQQWPWCQHLAQQLCGPSQPLLSPGTHNTGHASDRTCTSLQGPKASPSRPGAHASQDPTGVGPCYWQPESNPPRAGEQQLGLEQLWIHLVQGLACSCLVGGLQLGPLSPKMGGNGGLCPHPEELPLARASSHRNTKEEHCSPLKV